MKMTDRLTYRPTECQYYIPRLHTLHRAVKVYDSQSTTVLSNPANKETKAIAVPP